MSNNEKSWPQPIQALLAAFEDARFVECDGRELWSARTLAKLLGYSTWQRFSSPVQKARTICAELGVPVERNFNPVVKVSGGGKRGPGQEDFHLTRFACYLIAQNGDAAKRPEIGAAQIYFAIQTLKQEHLEKAQALEARREAEGVRLEARDAVKAHNVSLVETAATAGVKNFRNFNGAGVKGLYGDLNQAQVVARKELPTGANHLDYAGLEELGAYLFKATQAEAKIKREGIKGERKASAAHKAVGKAVREFIASIGGQMPEDLPPEEDIEKVRRRVEGQAVKPQLKKKDAA